MIDKSLSKNKGNILLNYYKTTIQGQERLRNIIRDEFIGLKTTGKFLWLQR